MVVVKKKKGESSDNNQGPILVREKGRDTITFEGKEYVRRNQKWTENNIIVPDPLQKTLNKILAENMNPLETTAEELIINADKFKESGDYLSAAKQYMEALVRSNRNQYASILPRLSSCYRKLGQPEKALVLEEEAVSIYGNKILNHAMLTSIAAAYCDLKKWDDARKYANRAYAVSEGRADVELMNVYSRIKAEK